MSAIDGPLVTGFPVDYGRHAPLSTAFPVDHADGRGSHLLPYAIPPTDLPSPTSHLLGGKISEAEMPHIAIPNAHHLRTTSPAKLGDTLQPWLMICGIVGAALYPLSDIVASTRYPGFSYRDQAVSELFAIGAPTSALVVTLFSISSTLIFLFAIGIWIS